MEEREKQEQHEQKDVEVRDVDGWAPGASGRFVEAAGVEVPGAEAPGRVGEAACADWTDFDEREFRLEAYDYPGSAWPMLTMELLHSGYEFGRLKLEYPVRDVDLAPAMRLLNRRRWMDWRQTEALDLVIGAERGILLLGLYRPGRGLNETLRSVYWDMRRVEFELQLAVWEADGATLGSLPVHTAVVTPEGLDEEDREEDLDESVPAADVILPDELPHLEERIDEIFAYRFDETDAELVEQTLRILKSADTGVGEYLGHQQCVERFVEEEKRRVTGGWHGGFDEIPY